MNTNSIWINDITLGKSNKLNKDIDVDVLIIGGGITGISTAYHLMNSNLKVALVERDRIGMGITSRSTAKITYLQENIYSKLNKSFGYDVAKKYFDSQKDAIKILKNIVDTNNISCDLFESESYLFTDDKEKIKDVKLEKDILKRFGSKVYESSMLPNSNKIKYAISVSGTYVFHPLKYLYSLKKLLLKNKINIYENSKVDSIEKEDGYYICKVNNFFIKTKKVVLALHYPYFLFPYLFPFKTTLEKSYIGVNKVDKDFHFNAINTSKPTKSIRYHKDIDDVYEINLVGSHNIAFKNNDKNNFSLLEDKKYLYLWSNIDIITNDYLPLIGKIDDNLLIGTGYNTWGMTNGSIAGKVLSDIILKKSNKYIDLFNPKRGINSSNIINFPVTLFSNMKSFVGSKINRNKSWYSNNVRFDTMNGKNVGIYVDDNNIKHIVYNKCPHLGCSLEFNEVEKTWDCPCHGSRFDLDGKCINGPSNYDISYKDNL